MNGDQNKQGNLVDTTDYLEAVGVLRGWKNFLFVIVALCLLLLQISFWLVNTGCVKAEKQTETPTISAEGEGAIPAPNIIEQAAQRAASTQPGEGTEKAPLPQAKDAFFGIKIKHVNWVIRFCNFVLILAGIVYCLTMLFSIKISLIGRLGGINHICRAFFLSLVMLVLLLPWQNFFDSIVMGAIYTPDELVRWCTAASTGILDTIFHYLRFTGLWALVVLLLIFSQLRSSRWTKAILRRLEVI